MDRKRRRGAFMGILSLFSLRQWLALVPVGTSLVACCPGRFCSTSTPQPAEPPAVGLADLHNQQFVYLGFGGSGISHSIDPTTSCLPVLPVVESFRARDLVRGGLFSAASNQAAKGECFPTVTNLASQRVDTDNLKRAW